MSYTVYSKVIICGLSCIFSFGHKLTDNYIHCVLISGHTPNIFKSCASSGLRMGKEDGRGSFHLPLKYAEIDRKISTWKTRSINRNTILGHRINNEKSKNVVFI